MTDQETNARQYLKIYGYTLKKGLITPFIDKLNFGYEIIRDKDKRSYKSELHPNKKYFLSWVEVVERVASYVPESLISLRKEDPPLITKKEIEELKKKEFEDWKRNRRNELKAEILEEAKKGMRKAKNDPFKMDILESHLGRMEAEIDKTIEKEENAVLESLDKKYEDVEIETN